MDEYSWEHDIDAPFDKYDAGGSAPGRVEFIGNHVDYNGGWVLGATIDRRVEVTIKTRSDRRIRLESSSQPEKTEVNLDQLEHQEGNRSWANYILGVVAVLRDEGLSVDTGFDAHVESTLPVGAGLSSSAALELASAHAVMEAFGGAFSRSELVRFCHRAENKFVGVPCGVLDQAVVAFGDGESLVRVDSRSGEISSVPFPPNTHVWIFRTHRTHALAEAHYQERHDEARAARDHLDELLGGVGHLVDVSPDQLATVRSELPDLLFRRARHVITEHERVKKAVRGLQEGATRAVGDLLYASHESSRRDYENSTPELDFIVDRLSDEEDVLGARLTGAGFGGAAMAWTRASFPASAGRAVQREYKKEFGEELRIMSCKPARGSFGYSRYSQHSQ